MDTVHHKGISLLESTTGSDDEEEEEIKTLPFSYAEQQ